MDPADGRPPCMERTTEGPGQIGETEMKANEKEGIVCGTSDWASGHFDGL